MRSSVSRWRVRRDDLRERRIRHSSSVRFRPAQPANAVVFPAPNARYNATIEVIQGTNIGRVYPPSGRCQGSPVEPLVRQPCDRARLVRGTMPAFPAPPSASVYPVASGLYLTYTAGDTEGPKFRVTPARFRLSQLRGKPPTNSLPRRHRERSREHKAAKSSNVPTGVLLDA